MANKFKLGKIVLVVFLTCLIWVWADQAKTEKLTVTNATISIAKSTNPKLWVSFDNKSTVALDKIVLKGSTSKVTEATRKLNEGSLAMDFFLELEKQDMAAGGEHTLDMLSFLNKSDAISQLGLSVESCKPRTLSVKVVELVEKPLEVRCFDAGGNLIKTKIIDPPKVNMFVPKDWPDSQLFAKVELTDGERVRAMAAPFEKTPFIEQIPGKQKLSATTVQISISTEEEVLKEFTIKSATIGYVFSPVLQGKYTVELLNKPEMAAVTIKASESAESQYRQQPYQILLYILDGDEKKEGELTRAVFYNFPEEFVRSGEIELKNKSPVEAIFRLVPIAEKTEKIVPK